MGLSVPSTLFDELTDFLASAPTPAQIIAFKPSSALDERLHELLSGNERGELSPLEKQELDDFLRMNHFLKMLKIKARRSK